MPYYQLCEVPYTHDLVTGEITCTGTLHNLSDTDLGLAMHDLIITTTAGDTAFFQEALYNVDPATVEAIFGGGLLLFVTGLGAGWVVNVLRQAR